MRQGFIPDLSQIVLLELSDHLYALAADDIDPSVPAGDGSSGSTVTPLSDHTTDRSHH